MAHLTGAKTKNTLDSIEVVSDDSLRVLRFRHSEGGEFFIETRDATESDWNYKSFALLRGEDANVIASVLRGGDLNLYGAPKIEGISKTAHTIPKPEDDKPAEPDCSPLEVEQAKAANIEKQRQVVELELERDHAKDLHVGAMVPGCPACDRRISPGYGDGSLPEPTTTSDDEGLGHPHDEPPF